MSARKFTIGYICEQIYLGEYPIGSELQSDRNMPEIIGISRQGYKEAVTILYFCGILKLRHGNKTIVANPVDDSFIKMANAFGIETPWYTGQSSETE